jgi:hypothetical protein
MDTTVLKLPYILYINQDPIQCCQHNLKHGGFITLKYSFIFLILTQNNISVHEGFQYNHYSSTSY